MLLQVRNLWRLPATPQPSPLSFPVRFCVGLLLLFVLAALTHSELSQAAATPATRYAGPTPRRSPLSSPMSSPRGVCCTAVLQTHASELSLPTAAELPDLPSCQPNWDLEVRSDDEEENYSHTGSESSWCISRPLQERGSGSDSCDRCRNTGSTHKAELARPRLAARAGCGL